PPARPAGSTATGALRSAAHRAPGGPDRSGARGRTHRPHPPRVAPRSGVVPSRRRHSPGSTRGRAGPTATSTTTHTTPGPTTAERPAAGTPRRPRRSTTGPAAARGAPAAHPGGPAGGATGGPPAGEGAPGR